MPKKTNGGRPSKMTETTLRKLEQGFSVGLSDREACLYADLSPSTLYSYCQKHPEFSERKELLKEQPKIKAKMVVYEALERGDLRAAQWYLERKAKEEFSSKLEMCAAVFEPVQIINDLGTLEE